MSRHVPPLLPSLAGPSARRTSMAWAGSTAVAALLVSGLAAWALSVPPTSGESTGDAETPLMLSLAPAPAIEAMSEPSPEVTQTVDQPQEVQPEEVPDTPELTEAPELPDQTPLPDQPVAEDVPLVDNEPPPALSEMVIPQKAEPKPKPEPKKEPKPEKPVKKAEKPPEKKAQQQAADGSAAAQPAAAAASAGAGGKAAKSYGADVMKKIRKTKKRRAPDKGVAVVQFAVGADGSLASVTLAKSSGSAGLDDLALDHIRRSAPFKAPPAGAQTKFSFEFKS